MPSGDTVSRKLLDLLLVGSSESLSHCHLLRLFLDRFLSREQLLGFTHSSPPQLLGNTGFVFFIADYIPDITETLVGLDYRMEFMAGLA